MSLKPLLSHVKRITTAKIGTLCKIRKYMIVDSALAIYKQMILPLFDYSGFLLLSGNKTDREDLQTIQNNALPSCLGIRLNDRISLVDIHKSANRVSLEQRRCIQLLVLLFLHGQSHPDIYSAALHNTRGLIVRNLRLKNTKMPNIKTVHIIRLLSYGTLYHLISWNLEQSQNSKNISRNCFTPMMITIWLPELLIYYIVINLYYIIIVFLYNSFLYLL